MSRVALQLPAVKIIKTQSKLSSSSLPVTICFRLIFRHFKDRQKLQDVSGQPAVRGPAAADRCVR